MKLTLFFKRPVSWLQFTKVSPLNFLSEDSKQFRKVSTGGFQPSEVYMVELKGFPFPVYLLTKQVFQNGDGKEASLYLITMMNF